MQRYENRCGSQWHTSIGETTTNASILPILLPIAVTFSCFDSWPYSMHTQAWKPSAQLLRENTHSTPVPKSEVPIPVGRSWHQNSFWNERPTLTKVRNRCIQPRNTRYHKTEIRLRPKEPKQNTRHPSYGVIKTNFSRRLTTKEHEPNRVILQSSFANHHDTPFSMSF
jgi:hypothetical protein